MHYPEIKNKAIKLRKEGYSYNYIADKVNVSKSTLSDWLIDVPFSPNKFTLETVKKAHLASGEYKHNLKVESIKSAEIKAKEDIKSLSSRDIMMLGLAIYIGEGTKTGTVTRIANSDPKIIRFTIKWLKTSFGVRLDQLKIRLHIYPDSDETESIEYWSKFTGVPKNQFSPSVFDRRTNKKKSNNGKLPYGTAHMSVKSLGNKKYGVNLHRRILAWINLVLC